MSQNAKNSLKFAGQQDTSGAVQEDGVVKVAGRLTAVDSDSRASLTWSVAGNGAGTYGSLAIDATGKWTYTLNNGAANVQSLADGENVYDTFMVTVTDSNGLTATQAVKMKIAGSNDAPVITAAAGQDAGAVVEDGTQVATGKLVGADLDHGAKLSWSVVGGGDGVYGALSIDGKGSWTYKLDNSAKAVQALAQGEHARETFTVKLSDGQGGTDTHTVTVDIAGTNDAPRIAGDSTAMVKEDKTLTAGGHLTASDADHGAQLTWSTVGSAAGTYGSFALDQNGNWTYALNNGAANVQALSGGAQVTDSLVVKVTDQFGASALQTVTVKVVGTDDAPVIAGTATGSVREDAVTTASGQLSLVDIDGRVHGDDHDDDRGDGDGHEGHRAGRDGNDHDHGDHDHGDHDGGNAWSVVGGGNGTYGHLSVDSSGKWTYVLNNAAGHVQALGAGESHIETFTVQVRTGDDDDDGLVVTQLVKVTVTGTNDAAVLSSAVANLTEADAAADLSTSGTLSISDVDSAATFVAQAGTAGSYGTFAIDAAGAWTYTASSAHNEFVAGQTYTDSFTVTSADGTTTSVTVNLLGANDAAVLSSAVANLTEADAAASISTSGTLAISDIDSAATFVAQAGTAGSYGTFAIDAAGAWTYTASSAHDAFVAGQTYSDSFAVASADGTATSVTVNLLGTNDAAVISGDVAGAAVEAGSGNSGGTPVATGTLTDTDVDNTPDSFQSVAAATAGDNGYGAYTMTADGTWTYTLDNGNAAVEALAAGDTLTDSFTVRTIDGTAQQVTVTIDGAADGPVNHAPVANDDILNSVVTFEPGTYSESRSYDDSLGYNRSFVDTNDGYRFADNGGGNDRLGDHVEGPSITVYEGVDYSYALYNYGVESVPYDTVTHNMPIEMTRMDGGVFALAHANLVAYDAYYKTAVLTETVTGYLNGVQGVTLTFDLPNTVDITVSHTNTVDLSGLGTVDRVEFVTVGTNNSSYNYNHTFIDNIEIAQSLTNEDTPVQIASATLLANDTDVDAGHVLHVGSVSATSALGAAVSIDGNGVITYDPTGSSVLGALGENEFANDSFTYTAVDEHGASSQATASLRVAGAADGPVNHAPVANDDILNAVVTFEPGTYSESRSYDDSLGYYRSFVDTNDGYRFADNGGGNDRLGDHVEGPSITVYEGVDYSYALYNYGVESVPYDTVTHNMPIEMTRMDGGVFALAHANLVAYDAYYKTAVLTETVTGYLNGVQGVTLTFDLPNTVDITVSHTNTVDLSGLGMVDRVEFVTVGTNNSTYNYNHTFIDNIEIVQSLTNEDTPVQIAAATLLANDTDVDAGHVLHVGSVSATSALGAAVTMDGNGLITYDPTGSSVLGALGVDQFANDSFIYTVFDEHGASSQATASLRVAGAYDAPMAQNHAPTVTGSLDGGTLYVWAGGDVPDGDSGGPAFNLNPDALPVVVHALDNATDADHDPLSVESFAVVAGNKIGIWNDVNYFGGMNINSSQAISFDSAANTFALDPNAWVLQGLRTGESATLTMAYNVFDGHATTPDSVSWTLVGTSDTSLVGHLVIA